MSLTSCYRYILELPVDTLNKMVRGALSESETAGVSLSQHWENVSIGGRTATVDVRPTDLDTNPPSMDLAATNLGFILHLRARIEAEINELPDLDKIIYSIIFDLPGVFEKDANVPPRLVMKFPAVTAAILNLVITGGEIPLTPELIEPRIHAMYDADPTLGHHLEPNVTWPLPGEPTGVLVTTDIYDDELGSPGFRGAISAEVPDQTQIKIHMPGHFKIQGMGGTYIDTDMTVIITVQVEHTDGLMRVKLSGVQPNDVVVNFVNTTIYDFGAKPIFQQRIAEKIRSYGDLTETIPSQAEVRDMITSRLIDFAGNLIIPIFTPQAPGPDEIDMTTFVPATVNQQVLALQLVPRADGTPCDTPDVFARATGFAIAIADVEVNPMLNSITSANNGDHHVQGYDITVSDLTGGLRDPGEDGQERGHIWITGTAEVHVDCWADPEIDFWGPIFLVPSLEDGNIIFTADAGDFGADDPCCADVDPGQIAELIEGERSTPVRMPQNFSGVGELTLTVTEAEIFRAGVVVHGGLEVLTMHALQALDWRKVVFWFFEQAGGG